MANGAQTLHSLFSLPTGDSASKRKQSNDAGTKKKRQNKNAESQRLDPLDGAALTAGRTLFANVRVVVLDELSTVSAQFLRYVLSLMCLLRTLCCLLMLFLF